jgi:transcriptional regulator with XRE-family HTH domain
MAIRLMQLRSVLEGNQAAVPRLLGIGVNTWNRYEKGHRDIDPVVLAQFCRVYGVSADWVLLGDLYSLPERVIAQMALAYPETVRSHVAPVPTNRRRSSDRPALEARP